LGSGGTGGGSRGGAVCDVILPSLKKECPPARAGTLLVRQWLFVRVLLLTGLLARLLVGLLVLTLLLLALLALALLLVAILLGLLWLAVLRIVHW
jgi:hypothetical protein